MSRYTARLKALEKRLAPPERPMGPIVVWTMAEPVFGEEEFHPPAWAEEAIRPHMPTAGVVWVEWHESRQADGYAVTIDGQWYEVTEAGAVPTPAAIPIAPNPFTLPLDNPNDTRL